MCEDDVKLMEASGMFAKDEGNGSNGQKSGSITRIDNSKPITSGKGLEPRPQSSGFRGNTQSNTGYDP